MPELLATCWTSAGNVRPGQTPNESPVPLSERVHGAVKAGFNGMGFELADLDAARVGMGFTALRRLLTDSGIIHVEVELLDDWWLTGPRREQSDRRRSRLLDAATALSAHHVKLGTGDRGDPRAHSLLEQELGLLAQQATAAGTRLALETGAGSALDLVDDALPLVRAVGSPAAGLLLDPWHFVRSGTPFAVIHDLVPEEIVAVELSDGAAQPEGNLFDDTFDNRLVPGSGAFDVRAFVRSVETTGWTGFWGVEVMSNAHRRLPVARALNEAAAAARGCFG